MAEIGVAKLTTEMLKAIWAAQRSGGTAAAAAEITEIAGQLGTSTQAVWNGVIAAQASSDAAVAGWAGTVAEGVASAKLGLSGEVVAAGAGELGAEAGILARFGATVAEWWAGASVVAQVVVVAGVLVVVVGGITWVIGQASEDPGTAAGAAEVFVPGQPSGDQGDEADLPSDDESDSSVDAGDGSDLPSEGIAYAGHDVGLDPASGFAAFDFGPCMLGPVADGNFQFEFDGDGMLVYGDYEVGGAVAVESAQPAGSEGCEGFEVTCNLEYLLTVRVRDGAAEYEFTNGRVFGPGHDGTPCDRTDYVDAESATGEPGITFDVLTAERVEGTISIGGVPFATFAGDRQE